MEEKSINLELAKLLIPESVPNLSEIIARYPVRNLPTTAKVVRVAPSPTGFAHFGLVFTSVINEHLAHQSNGVFFLRIEDTDKKREVVGGIQQIVFALKSFDINYSEGPIDENRETGNYGPYVQSKRQEIYLSAARYLIENGSAYPCFCHPEKLASIHETQEQNKERTGYYGKYAACRNLSVEEVKSKINSGEPFTIRFKTPKKASPSMFDDVIKGQVTLPENDVDYVLVKSGDHGLGLPVYHFAAMVDDRLQGVNLVIRGSEWLPSLPLHLQIIDSFGWERPGFGHLSPIMKMDGETSKRKLSKRKDPEADAVYYLKQGIPSRSVRAYVLTLADSRFEDWRKQNQSNDLFDFPFSLSHMGSTGALLDMTKFMDISKQEIANMSAEEIYPLVEKWSQQFNPEFNAIFTKNKEYSTRVLNIEREGDKKRKDISQWSQIPELFGFFYDEIFDREKVSLEAKTKNIIEKYLDHYNHNDSKEEWFEKMKLTCTELGYAASMKDFKNNPENYSGHLGDVAMALRISLSGKTMTPDLYEMIQVMGEERVVSRLKKAI